MPAIFASRKFVPKPVVAVGPFSIQSGRKYHCFAARETSLVRDELFCSWIVDHGTADMLNVPNGKILDYFVEEVSWHSATKKHSEYLLRHWDAHFRKYAAIRDELYESAVSLCRAVRKNDRKEILSRFRRDYQIGYLFCDYVLGAWAVIYDTEKHVSAKYSEVLGIVNALDKPIEYFKMKRDLLRLPVAKVIEKYGWLKSYSPHHPPYSRKELEALRKETNADDVAQQLRQFKKNEKAFHELIDSIRDKTDRTRLKMVHAYAFLKTDRVDVWKKWHFLKNPFYEYLVRLIPGADLNDVCNLSIRETEELLSGTMPVALQELKLRSQNRVLYHFTRRAISVITTPESVRGVAESLVTKQGAEELRGTVACKGKATGAVKIIREPLDIKKVKRGDIFVAKFTLPIFTPQMMIAKAIVTDEGGITSHAAIVGREYGIPTIVGTRHATQVLKDGDLVEVDADKGVVKIIQKS